MGKSRLLAAGLAVLLGGLPGVALADATLTVVMGGEAFKGAPKFSVTFDGKPVGDGTLDHAIDTSSDGRFADQADKAKYVQSFDFKVPDDVFKPDGVVAIALANPAEGAAGSKEARELFVQSVAVNGKVVPAMSLSMRSDLGVEPVALLGDYLVVSDAAVKGIALPADGWPKATVAAAASATTPAPAEDAKPASTTVDVASAPADAPVAPANAPAVPDAKVQVAEATPPAVTKAATDVVADDAGNPDPEGGVPSCGLTQKFQIIGFNENSNDLTPRTRKALDTVVKAIGSQKCVVHLTGYSSTEGDFAHNALFSIERSQNALRYLAEQGVQFRKYSANGVGETTQFGASPGANRRVVVTVSP